MRPLRIPMSRMPRRREAGSSRSPPRITRSNLSAGPMAARTAAGRPVEFVVGSVEPERRITFQWHPFAVDKAVDVSREPMTTIVFELEDVTDGTRLTITESGFEAIPASRREKAYAANEGGWAHQ